MIRPKLSNLNHTCHALQPIYLLPDNLRYVPRPIYLLIEAGYYNSGNISCRLAMNREK